MNLETEFLGVKFANPLVVASGILGVTGASLKYVAENGAGGVTTKSIWVKEHVGHKSPVMIANEHYMLNAVGLPDAGIEKARLEIGKYLENKPAPLIASIVAGKVDDFGEVAEQVSELKPDIIEVNISCPNVESELGKPFACVAADAAVVTSNVKKRTGIPVVVKLSPNVENLVVIAKAVADAGADGLTLINTVGPGMAIDLDMRSPILTNRVGGISGPAIKPVAVKCVYEVHKAMPNLPIIGTGGITTGEDAIEIIMAGATLVGVGTAVYYRDIECFRLIAEEMGKWCDAHGVKNLSEIRGAAVR